ncbi:alkane hydroxylase MAH1-like [Solanum dulcamara]|uniref:alkane hydroxylase MAH1-like n=1 Tax=Solanum dulcamara TaxID=45834 RepID=UPI0024863129|nr:alkane hydroxylase MAH1-like [Solanum dulcamara]
MVLNFVMSSIGYFEFFVAIFCFLVFWALGDRSGAPWNWPFLGMFPSLIFHVNRIHERCFEVFSRSGGTFLLKGPWFTNMDILGTIDPENVHYIMSANFANFPKGEEFKKIFDVLGDGIFNSDLDLWKEQRKYARSLITHQRFYNCLVKASWDKIENGLVPVLEIVARENRIVDLQDVFQRFTFDTTCLLITGYDPGCLSIEFPCVPFSKAMDEAEEVLFIRHLLPKSVRKLQQWLGIGDEAKLTRAWHVLDQVISKYISMKREELSNIATKSKEDEEGGCYDLLTSYMLDDGLNFDDKFLRDTTLNLMIAGRDTTSSGLTWFIWLVVTHPEVEKRIMEELMAIISLRSSSSKPRIFNTSELKNATYLHASLCESLRLYPPVPFQHKTPLEPDVLPSGHHVHPKMRVVFSLYAMGRMESIWGKDCLEFKPERWITERGTIRHEPSYKFLAFNAGPRTCLGKEVAFTQMKAVAASIIHNYQVEVIKGHKVFPNVSIILYMQHGFKARIKKRWT